METSNRQITNHADGKILAAYLLVFATARNARAVRLTSKCLRVFFKQKALEKSKISLITAAVRGTWSAYQHCRPKSGGQYVILYLDNDAKIKKATPATLDALPSISEISERIFPGINNLVS